MWTLVLMGFDLQGHRGARGLHPENTLTGFRAALELGVTTLELDLGLTKDGVLVVHHDTHLSPATARGADGTWIAEERAISSLTLAEVHGYDVGRLNPDHAYAARWPEQLGVDGERIPALAEVLDLDGSVAFNIETKLDATHPDHTRPPEDFVTALKAALADDAVRARVTVQSFDWRTLVLLKGWVRTACLTDADTVVPQSPWTAGFDPAAYASLPALVAAVGCEIWSPNHAQLSEVVIAEAHALGLKVVPWTVNDPARGDELVAWGVDGLITDYPDRVRGPVPR